MHSPPNAAVLSAPADRRRRISAVRDARLHNEIAVHRFSVSVSGQRYAITLDGSGPYDVLGGVATANDIALWRNETNDNFMMAIRPSGVGSQPIYAFDSTDGISWDFVDTGVGPSAVGPSAASMETGTTNLITYLR